MDDIPLQWLELKSPPEDNGAETAAVPPPK